MYKRVHTLDVRLRFIYSCLVLYGISVFAIGCLYTCMVHIRNRNPSEIRKLMVNKTTIDTSHQCFKLFGHLSNFSNVVGRKQQSCRLVTHSSWKGGLGNQMFEAAAVVGIAHDLDMVPVMNLTNSALDKYFNIPTTTLNTDVNNVVKCQEKGGSMYSDCLDIFLRNRNTTSRNIMIGGYRQSWKYFERVTAIIRNMYQLKRDYMTTARHFITKKTVLGHDNVCIQVRRGDFLSPISKSMGRTVAGTEFISKAMQYFENKFTSVRFIVLSDDILWCKQNIKGNVTFSPYTDPGVDLAIMSLCDHVVVTSGTFGWWGAWLSNGTVVYDHGFPRSGSKLSKGFNSSDYYPRNWIKL